MQRFSRLYLHRLPGRKPNAHHYHQCYQQPSSQRTEQKAQKTPLYRPCGNQFRPSDGKLRYTYIIANNHCGQRHQCKQQQSLACQEAEYLILCATHSQAQSYLTTAATGTEPKRSDQSQEYIYQQEKHYNCLTVHLVRISVHDSAEVTTVKDKRKDANAEVKTYTTICANAEKQLKPGDVKTYAEKKDITALMEEQNENARLIEKAKTVRQARQQRIEQLEAIPGRIKTANDNHDKAVAVIDTNLANEEKEVARIIAEAQKRLEDAKKEAKISRKNVDAELKETLATIEAEKTDFEKRKANADKWLEEYEANNPEKLDTAEQLKKAEEHNRINALVVDYMAKKKQKEAAEKTARTFEDKLGALAKERETLIATSKLPIAGLSFTDDGLELNGVPFVAGKVSDSQIMEVAAKLIIASNPTVKVFRIARGESLGEKRLQAIIDIAKQNGFQGFIEEVKRGQTDLVVEEYTENE